MEGKEGPPTLVKGAAKERLGGHAWRLCEKRARYKQFGDSDRRVRSPLGGN